MTLGRLCGLLSRRQHARQFQGLRAAEARKAIEHARTLATRPVLLLQAVQPLVASWTREEGQGVRSLAWLYGQIPAEIPDRLPAQGAEVDFVLGFYE